MTLKLKEEDMDTNQQIPRNVNVNFGTDEFHFLMVCRLYKSKREKLFQNIYEVFPNIRQNSSKIQFLWLMSQENEKCTTDITKFATPKYGLKNKGLGHLTQSE